ncbi:mitochondrial 37S ribosomal protein rsm10 [Didymosphaeria variabile]|uniref:Mitochondrial 37S ribosomal protein rsm10 n=1 Tax=Didymosphaeria variabile TaxID=1932322 RepID=A0A9W9CAQ3_9PLEO|nr:mitochondrial 37S ribosomal protein rsm10 [Didymosphaeria variabile]KAJ4353961.1 mitochondrial 37S ribosomal protein rsm10 [Didymosphaeria variabile]
MAVPRSLWPFLAPTKRIKIIPPRASAQTFLRCRSNRAEDREDDRERRSAPGDDNDVDIYAEMEKGEMPIEQRLEHMGLDAAEYTALKTSSKRAQKKFDNWTPNDKAEAQRKWKKMANTPDDLTLLEMFKKGRP